MRGGLVDKSAGTQIVLTSSSGLAIGVKMTSSLMTVKAQILVNGNILMIVSRDDLSSCPFKNCFIAFLRIFVESTHDKLQFKK